jgi:hypothetical protein
MALTMQHISHAGYPNIESEDCVNNCGGWTVGLELPKEDVVGGGQKFLVVHASLGEG